MFSSILIPTDFTPKSRPALEIGKNLAKIFGSKLTLLHVIETIEGTSFDEFKDFYEKLYKKAERELQRLIDKHGDEITIHKAIVFGKRAPEIVKYAHLNMVDLIIMSSHKIDPSQEQQGFGTISYKVGLMATCPILLVK